MRAALIRPDIRMVKWDGVCGVGEQRDGQWVVASTVCWFCRGHLGVEPGLCKNLLILM